MSSIALSLLVLSCGWMLFREWFRTRYRALKDAGHPQYFAAAVSSAYVFILGCSLHLAAKTYAQDLYAPIEAGLFRTLPAGIDPKENNAALQSLVAATAWSLLLAYPLSQLFNLPLRACPPLLRAIVKKAGAFDEVEAIATYVLDRQIALAVTLKTGKVYIGVPTNSSKFDEERKWLALFPYLSGKRAENGTLSITTRYSSVYREILSRITPESADSALREFQILLPLAEVATLQTFNLTTYSAFHTTTAAPAPTEISSDHQATASELSISEYSADERYRLTLYDGFLATSSVAIAILPHSLPWFLGFSLIAALLGFLAAGASEIRYS